MTRSCHGLSAGARLVIVALALLGVIALSTATAWALETVDDLGNRIYLASAAERVVTLSPHATELAVAAGLSEQLVAISRGSPPPRMLADLPRLGGFGSIDRERLLSLAPDLVIAWDSGNRAQDLAWLERNGITVFRSEPSSLIQLIDSIRRIGRLGGSDAVAKRNAAALAQRLATPCATLAPQPVYVEVWHRPAMTVGGAHWLNSVLHVAGYRNVFASRPLGVFAISDEARATVSTLPVISLVPTDNGDPVADRLSVPGTAIFDAVDALCTRRLQHRENVVAGTDRP